jgi:hypothetical protein
VKTLNRYSTGSIRFEFHLLRGEKSLNVLDVGSTSGPKKDTKGILSLIAVQQI